MAKTHDHALVRLARRRPIVTFLLINFVWTWLFWLGAIPLASRDGLLLTTIVIIGGYGPAIGGIVTLGLRSGQPLRMDRRQVGAMAVGTLLIFGVMTARYLVGNVAGYGSLAGDLALSAPIVVAAAVGSLVGGWVISAAVTRNPDVRSRMRSILPWQHRTRWTLFGLLFYAAMILVAWGLASLVGLGVEYPGLWGRPALDTVPFYALVFALTALAQGGNEEPGWRGLMQPELQKRHSPLVAALIVSAFWSLWHLPLYLNGFYGEPLVGGMIGGGIYRVLLSIFLAWLYNRSDGDLFLMIWLHTSFNVLVNFLPTSDLGLLVLWVIVVVVVVVRDKMTKAAA